MTKFEQVGINYQYDAVDKKSANKSFKISCNICCNRGMHLDCDRCAIAVAHSLVVASFGEGDSYEN